MADSTSQFLGTFLGGGGGGSVVTAAGIQFSQAGAPGAGTAYWNYDGANLVGNVPTGKGFNFLVNGAQVGRFNGGLQVKASVGTLSNLLDGSNFINFSQNSAFDVSLNSDVADGAAAKGIILNNGITLSNATAKLLSVQNNGTEMFAFSPGGHPIGPTGANANTVALSRTIIGLGAGTTSSGTAVTASGHDMAGRVGVTVNSTGTASQPILLVAYANGYASPPFMSIAPANAATASIAVAQAPFVVTTTSGWSLMANTTGLAVGGPYVWMYAGTCQ